jgi:hypothetical protein
MADQRAPSDRGIGAKDPEDYPPGAGPVRVGKAPLPDRDRERLPAGVAPPLPPIDKREKTKEMAWKATRQDSTALQRDETREVSGKEGSPHKSTSGEQ